MKNKLKLKKFWIGISILTICGITAGLISENLNNSHNSTQNYQINNQSLTVPNTISNSIYYSGINSADFQTENNLKTFYKKGLSNWLLTYYKRYEWFDDNNDREPADFPAGWTWYPVGSSLEAPSKKVELSKTSYSENFIQEQINLPVNPKDWTNQKYTINTNWTGGFNSFGKSSYTITASPGQQVFTVEDSNIDGYNPLTDTGNSGNGDDGMNIDPLGRALKFYGRDGLKTEIVIDKKINGNVLTAKIYLKVTTVNRGNGNKYAWNGLGGTTITVKSITPALNDISDNDFNNGLQKALSNLSYVSDWSNSVIDSKNWTDIQKFITSKITSYVDSINKKQNYQKTFNVEYNLTNSTASTINLTIYYDSLKGSSGTITSSGTNQYQTAFNLNVPIKMLLSDKYYADNAWGNVSFDTNYLNYDPTTGKFDIESNSGLSQTNPWYNLVAPPIPLSDTIYTTGVDSPDHPVYPDFGTFKINHRILFSYKRPLNEEQSVHVNGSGPNVNTNKSLIDVLEGKYSYELFDGRLQPNKKLSPDDVDKPTTWTIEIRGNKNGQNDELLFKITFIIDETTNPLDIKYLGWNPNDSILGQWQQSWINSQTPNGLPNPNYKPAIDPTTGLGSELVWVKSTSPYWDKFSSNKSSLYPDPIAKDGSLIYSTLKINADGEYEFNGNSDVANLPSDNIGSITQAYVSPKAIYENSNSNQEVIRTNILNGQQKIIQPAKNPDLSYNDKVGIYDYSVLNKENNTSSNYMVAIDPKITSQNFSEYVNQKLGSENIIPFWQSLAGQHLADYLYNKIHMTNDDINNLTYNQVLSYWNLYVKDAVLLNENKTTPKYNLNNLALASIKVNTTNPDDLKKQVLINLQDQMNHLADRLTLKKKQDLEKVNKGYTWHDETDKVHLEYNKDYYISNLDSINWNLLANLNKTQRSQSINLNVVATTPNANLVAGSSTNLKVINSLDFNNLYNLFNAQISTWNANTNSLAVLKQGISDNVNDYLSKATGQKITNNDWYLKESDAEISNSLLPNGSTNLQIVASDASPYLINSTTIIVNNQTTNPFDLRNIQIPKLNINSDDKGTIWQSIYNWVKEYVSKNYSNLILDTDYKIQISDADINAIIDEFNNNTGDYTINQVIVPVNDKTQGYTNLVVNDAKANELTNNVAPVPGSNNPYAPQTPTSGNGTNNPNGPSGVGDVDSGNQGYFSNKSNIAWVSTVATIGGIILIILIYGFIVRQMDNAETLSGIFFKRKNRKYWQQRALEDAEYQRKSDLGIEDDDEVIDYYDEGESDFSKGWTEFKRRFMPKRYAKQQAMKEQEEREQEEYLKRAKESFEKAKRDKDPFTPEEREELERLKAIAREERLRLKMEREIKEKGLSEEYED